jgi:hypothetical protein
VNAVAELSQATETYLSDLMVSKPSWTFSCQALGSYGQHIIEVGNPVTVVWNYKLIADTPLGAPSDPKPMELAWLGDTVKGLGNTLSLSRGWDTYDGAPVSARSVQRALAFLVGFLEPSSPTPAVVPLSDGGVQMEWHRGGLDIELTFSPREAAELYVRDLETGDEWEGDATPELVEQVRPLLARLRAAQ